MKNKEILLVSDIVGVGKVALSTMIPILSAMEAKLSYLPTSVISNNFEYGEAAIHDLTDYMEETKEVWEKHKFQFDIITTGIVMNTKQVDIIEEIIENQTTKPLIIADPIMGDEGDVYPGLSPDIVKASRAMVPLADIILPNLTEVSLILGEEYPEKITHDLLVEWIEELKNMGVKSSAITSVKIDGKYYVYGYSHLDDEIFRVEYRYIPVRFGGTGDIFSSLMTGELARGVEIKEAVEYSTRLLSDIIEMESKKELPEIREISIQNYFNYINEFE